MILAAGGIVKKELLTMDEKNLNRKPLTDTATVDGTPTDVQYAVLSEKEERLLHIIRESEDPTVLLQMALKCAEDCLKRLERSE